ncbi:MAG TPA: hypothetical protein VF658_14265 [Pyrinomonadaceae bacterium]|jgi:hypothetical protein
MKSSLITVLILLLNTASTHSLQPKFDYLKVKGQTVESTHQIKYRLQVDKSFHLLGEYHHQPTYGGKMFNVSVAAYAKGESLLMIHAEAHTDGSGGLDYSNLKPDPLNGISFNSREQCAVLAEIPDPYSIPDLRFLRDKGFSPAPAMFLKQYLIASADGSAEYVLSYGRRVASCDGEVITPQFKAQIEQEARSVLKVKKK